MASSSLLHPHLSDHQRMNSLGRTLDAAPNRTHSLHPRNFAIMKRTYFYCCCCCLCCYCHHRRYNHHNYLSDGNHNMLRLIDCLNYCLTVVLDCGWLLLRPIKQLDLINNQIYIYIYTFIYVCLSYQVEIWCFVFLCSFK